MTNGWPNPERPGVPINPDRDGWHWLLFRDGARVCCWWNSRAQGWASSDTREYGADYLPEEADQDHIGCEPCLLPAEVAALVEAARDEATEKERDACADIAEGTRDSTDTPLRRAREDFHRSEIDHQEGRWHASNDIAEAIRARGAA